MCWKEEWAYAIEKISKAIAHIENAKKKLKKRWQKAAQRLQKQSQDPKHNQPSELAKIREIMNKHTMAIIECEHLIAALKKHQATLRLLIEKHGIFRTAGGSARVKKILEEAFG